MKKIMRKMLNKRVPRSNDNLSFVVRFTHPVLKPGKSGEWDEDDVHSHWVLKDDYGKYWMYYNGKQKPNSERGIGLAKSNDGINFLKTIKNPILTPILGTWESDCLWKCQVLNFGDDDFRIWYGGHLNDIGQVGYATSRDGIHWKRYERNPVLTVGKSGQWDSRCAENFRVLHEKNGEFIGLYLGAKEFGRSAIGLTTSPDGINWTKYKGNPVIKPLSNSWEEDEISPFHLMKVDDIYALFYEGRGKYNDWMIGLAYSENLIEWYRDLRNPILKPGFPGDFDAEFVSDPSLVEEPDNLKLYYGGLSNNGIGYVGLACLPLKEKFRDYFRNCGKAWINYHIKGGDKTDGITCRGCKCEIYFNSDKRGTLTISSRDLNGNWNTYAEVKTSYYKNVLYSIRDTEAVRISFDKSATVTAWYVLKRLKLYDDIFGKLGNVTDKKTL